MTQDLKNSENRDFLFFWGHHEKSGKVTKACLSQWYPCFFTIDGVRYSTAEQYMMAEKARLMGDEACREAIMATSDPNEIKALGRQVDNFDETLWNKEKSRVVEKGNLAKFSQNEALKTFLLSTEDKVLVEASPYDSIWGIGLRAEDAEAQDPRQWKGSNLLGFALMKVRQTIRSRQQRVTPGMITRLADDEIFVFGSNLGGYHGGGAAAFAMQHFGAVWGCGVGLQGQSYAIPTMQGGVETIRPYTDQFIEYAKANTRLKFLVTPIGCGIAGFHPAEIAELFKEAVNVENIYLPNEFWVFLKQQKRERP